MSANADNEENASLRYWKAVISTLPPTKRDAAWEFYLNKFSNDRAGDTLSGLILLLEAHGVYMQNLPIAYDAELIQPMKGLIADVKRELQQFTQVQQEFRESTRQSVQATAQFSQNIALYGNNLGQKVQIAVQEINTERIGSVISRSLEESTLAAIKADLKGLSEVSSSLKQCYNVAEKSAEHWKSLQFSSTLGYTFILAFILAVTFTCAYLQYRR